MREQKEGLKNILSHLKWAVEKVETEIQKDEAKFMGLHYLFFDVKAAYLATERLLTEARKKRNEKSQETQDRKNGRLGAAGN